MSLNGTLFTVVDIFWKNLRTFSYRNRTVLEAGFILLYAGEQVILVLLTFTATSVQELSFIISLFAILVLTTFSLHKLVMESRIKALESELSNVKQQGEFLVDVASKTMKNYEELHKSVTEHLNNSATIFNKKKVGR